MTTGERMRQRRKELGLSAEYVADLLNVSPVTIYRYENGGIEKMPGNILEPISRILNTTPSYLMGWNNNPEDKEEKWTYIYKANLEAAWESVLYMDRADIDAAINEGFDFYGLEQDIKDVLSGKKTLTFEIACDIADRLGEPMDSLLGRDFKENPVTSNDDGTGDIINLLNQLSPDNRDKLLELAQMFLDAQRKSKENQ